MRGRCSLLLKPFQQVAFGKRGTNGGMKLNHGLLSEQELGDSFTEPEVYRNRKNVTAQVKVGEKTSGLRREERMRRQFERSHASDVQLNDIRLGRTAPRTDSERSLDEMFSDVHLEASNTADYTVDMQRELKREAERRRHHLSKFGQTPTATEYHKLLRRTQSMDKEEESVAALQHRLTEETGLYSSSRLDAYMLDDDSYFPEWVNALPYAVRDQVKYGSLGITDEDEALRVRLNRLPRDKRESEWQRMKAAKEFKAANDEMLTIAELRDARQGKRRFHWLQRKREHRAQDLRRMALRKPEYATQWPSNVVDLSQRIAFIAQHVENGVNSMGQWPLDAEALLRAKARRSQSDEESAFLSQKKERMVDGVAGDVGQLLTTMNQTPKKFRRVSRKVYANRVNAVVHGDQDEYGRKYRKVEKRGKARVRAYDSFREMALEKEVRKEPIVHTRGLHHQDDENWNRRFKSFADGMPSTRYGS
ncbi:hypothetical protein AGDE_02268 [Angomonas deanei]|nr:hypothetical protein AGDE_02268 [Angomonas deanei]|eukprot:EPY41656.1 hypothetical protein AGDE_02268 [Angomonas deanei]